MKTDALGDTSTVTGIFTLVHRYRTSPVCVRARAHARENAISTNLGSPDVS